MNDERDAIKKKLRIPALYNARVGRADPNEQAPGRTVPNFGRQLRFGAWGRRREKIHAVFRT